MNPEKRVALEKEAYEQALASYAVYLKATGKVIDPDFLRQLAGAYNQKEA